MPGHLRLLKQLRQFGLEDSLALSLIFPGESVRIPTLLHIKVFDVENTSGVIGRGLRLIYPPFNPSDAWVKHITEHLAQKGYCLEFGEPEEDECILSVNLIPLNFYGTDIQESVMTPAPEPVAARFFCPGCGCRLYRDPRVNTDRDPYHVFCINKSCVYAFASSLVVHHPIFGIDSAAGDSWSISYVK